MGAVIDADDIADGIDSHVVEAAVLHPGAKLLRHGLVRVGEVGHRQFARFLEAGVAVHRQRFGPVPHLLTACGRDAKFVVEPNLCNAVDVAQVFCKFKVGVACQTAFENGDDFCALQPHATRPAHGQDEGPAELRVVVGIELLDVRKLGRRAVGQAGVALFAAALRRQAAAHHGLAGQFRVGADQGQLLLSCRAAPAAAHAGHERSLQRRQAGERTLLHGPFGNPG